jgi:hypothetical protein
MYQQDVLDADELRLKRINFWFIWTTANALGAAIGWAVGESLGRILPGNESIRLSMLLAGIVFEISIWLPRIWVSRYFRELNLFGFLETVGWMATEVLAWIIIDISQLTSVTWFTLGASFSITSGASLSMLLLLNGTSRSKSRKSVGRKPLTILWFIKTFFITLFGFIALNLVFTFLWIVPTEIERSTEASYPLLGWVMEGLLFGGGIGAVTGFGYSTKIERMTNIQK